MRRDDDALMEDVDDGAKAQAAPKVAERIASFILLVLMLCLYCFQTRFCERGRKKQTYSSRSRSILLPHHHSVVVVIFKLLTL
mmetsp:Transcript_37926/g.57731  ORF Transcript_37926/g.57731 Transcript_37926/m.57731 type:complete len:83 (-) Transcript_37926:32-280(-)